MTKEEAKQVFLSRGFVEVEGGTIYDADKWRESCHVISEWLEQEPYDDAISRQAVLKLQYRIDDSATLSTRDVVNVEDIEDLPNVTPKENVTEFADRCRECGARMAEKYKDCFQPKSNQQPLNEEVAKAFQLGMSFGFIDGLNANKNDIPLDELRAELYNYITHSPYINGCTNCCRLRDDVLRIVDKYKVENDRK